MGKEGVARLDIVDVDIYIDSPALRLSTNQKNL
jgi:hypothetical protein